MSRPRVARAGDAVAPPPVGARVELDWPGCERGAPSRVDAHGAQVFSVLAPLAHPAAVDPREGGPVTVSWHTFRGVHRMAATLVGVEASGGDRLWWVLPTEPVSVLQRRCYVRVPASVILRLDGPSGPSTAVSVDLSEGGVGARLARDGVDPWGFSELTLPVDDRLLVAPIRTVRVGVDAATGRWSIGAGFVELPRHEAALLRRHVYERQILLRRLGDRAR